MKKNNLKNEREDLKGFEDFLEEPKQTNETKKEISYEHLTFLENDAKRMQKIKKIQREKIPATLKNSQHELLISKQEKEIHHLKELLFQTYFQEDSTIKRSLEQLFDVYR